MRRITTDKVVLLPLLTAGGSLGLFAAVVFYFFDRLAPQMPLFYSIPWGENQLVSRSVITILPLIGVIFLAINFVFGLILLRFEKFLARIITIGAILTAILVTITGIKIILLTHL